MSNSIGGSVTGQVGMDVSGVVTGAKEGAQAVADMSASFTRSSAVLSAAETHYNAMADSMTRAASQAELLTARMLKASSATSAAGSRGRQSASAIVGGMSGSGREQAFQQSITARINEFASNRDSAKMASGMSAAGAAQSQSGSFANRITDWSRLQTVKNADYEHARIETENRVQRIAAGAAAGHTRQVLAYIREQEQARLDAEQRVERIAAGAAAGRARQVIAGIREMEAARTQNTAFRPNADTRNPMQAMEDSIARMRGELNPMVGMQHRLAREAMEFRQQMDLAVISGRMNWQTAQGILNTYEQVSAELQQQAMQQQAGFLGMRRMGFAAQQFGYAIEDAASVYGTMGWAGAFRAAGNNLTVMAAQAGPMVGTFASIASAAIAIGINLNTASRNAKELKKSVDELKELTDKLKTQYATQISLEKSLQNVRRANHDELMKMFNQVSDARQQIIEQQEAQRRADESVRGIVDAQKALKDNASQMVVENKKWWETVLILNGSYRGIALVADRLPKAFMEVVRVANDEMVLLAQGEQALKSRDRMLADQLKHKQELVAAEERGKKALEDALDPEKQRLKLLEAGTKTLESRWKLSLRPLPDEADIRRPGTMRSRSSNFGNDPALETKYTPTGSAVEITRYIENLNTLYRKRSKWDDEHTLSLKQQEQSERFLSGILDDKAKAELLLRDLGKEGESDRESAKAAIMSRYESLNEELRINNEVLETRKKINKEIDFARDSGAIDWVDAIEMKNSLERVFQEEKKRRENEKEIAKLQKREGTLEGLARQALTPATVLGGLTKGSDEARAFLENERLKSMAQKDADPQVKELKEIRAEIKRLRESNEKIGQSKPGVVTLV